MDPIMWDPSSCRTWHNDDSCNQGSTRTRFCGTSSLMDAIKADGIKGIQGAIR